MLARSSTASQSSSTTACFDDGSHRSLSGTSLLKGGSRKEKWVKYDSFVAGLLVDGWRV
jgi:hypothetical protein